MRSKKGAKEVAVMAVAVAVAGSGCGKMGQESGGVVVCTLKMVEVEESK